MKEQAKQGDKPLYTWETVVLKIPQILKSPTSISQLKMINQKATGCRD